MAPINSWCRSVENTSAKLRTDRKEAIVTVGCVSSGLVRSLPDYIGDDDPGFDGVTVQWFEDMDAYRAHMAEPDFPDIWTDISNFLDTDKLHFVMTEHPRVVMGDDAGSFPLA